MLLQPPTSTRSDTLFPCPTPFRSVVPQRMQGVCETAPIGVLQHTVAFEKPCVGKLPPQRLKLLPLRLQPALKLVDHALVGRTQRLDVVRRHMGKKGDAITLASPTLRHFQDAAGADHVMNRFAEGFLPRLADRKSTRLNSSH